MLNVHKSKISDSPSAETKEFIYKKRKKKRFFFLNIALRSAKTVKKMQSRELSRDMPSAVEE